MIQSKGTAPFWLQVAINYVLIFNDLLSTCKHTHARTHANNTPERESEWEIGKESVKEQAECMGNGGDRKGNAYHIHTCSRTYVHVHVHSWTSSRTSLAFDRAYFDWDWKWHAIRAIKRVRLVLLLLFCVYFFLLNTNSGIFAATVATATLLLVLFKLLSLPHWETENV